MSLNDDFPWLADALTVLGETRLAARPDAPTFGDVGRFARGVWEGSNPLQRASLLTTPLPIVPDALGLAGDIQMYRDQPETRGPLNYALSGLGLLPFVPPVAAGIKRGVDPMWWYHGTGSDIRGAINPAPHDDLFIKSISVTPDPAEASLYATNAFKRRSRLVNNPQELSPEEALRRMREEGRMSYVESGWDPGGEQTWAHALLPDEGLGPDDIRRQSADLGMLSPQRRYFDDRFQYETAGAEGGNVMPLQLAEDLEVADYEDYVRVMEELGDDASMDAVTQALIDEGFDAIMPGGDFGDELAILNPDAIHTAFGGGRLGGN